MPRSHRSPSRLLLAVHSRRKRSTAADPSRRERDVGDALGGVSAGSTDEKLMAGKRALVVGTGGAGQAVAYYCARAGAQVSSGRGIPMSTSYTLLTY